MKKSAWSGSRLPTLTATPRYPANRSAKKSTRWPCGPERPVAAKEAVPVERFRLATETVTEDAAVSETVRKEQIEEPEVDVNPRDAGR